MMNADEHDGRGNRGVGTQPVRSCGQNPVNFEELGGPPHPSMERGSHHDHALLPLISEKGFMPAAPTMGAAGATFEAP